MKALSVQRATSNSVLENLHFSYHTVLTASVASFCGQNVNLLPTTNICQRR